MKTTLLVCLVCLLGVATYGQNGQVKITRDKNGVINYIKFPPKIVLKTVE